MASGRSPLMNVTNNANALPSAPAYAISAPYFTGQSLQFVNVAPFQPVKPLPAVSRFRVQTFSFFSPCLVTLVYKCLLQTFSTTRLREAYSQDLRVYFPFR